MNAQLANMVYGSTKLTGIFDWILDAIVYVIDFMFQKVLYWILNLVYEVAIYLPLKMIDAISTMLRFFCGGFANWIFGNGQPLWDPTTGRINVNFSLTSPLGEVVMFALVLGAVMFFIFFMLSFRAGAKNSEGKPFKGSWSHAKLLKWPLFMILSVTILPFLFVFFDSLMQSLLMYFNGSKATPFTAGDISNFKYLKSDYDNFTNSIGSTKITVLSSSYSLSVALSMYSDAITQLKAWASGQDAVDVQNFPAFASSLTRLLTDVSAIQTYVDSGMLQDKESVVNIINSAQAGQFLSDDNANTLSKVAANLYDFQNNITNYLAEDITDLSNSVYSEAWAAVDTHNTSFTTDLLWTQANVTDTGNAIVNSAIQSSTSKDTLYMAFQSMNNIITGQNGKYIGLSFLPAYTNSAITFNIPGIIYSVISGDPNPNNWTDPYGHDFAKHASIFQWLLGTFSVWSMILIVYTYTYASISRVYYLLGYWVLGFLFLANGITKEKQAIGWFKKIFFKWFEVLVLMLCFELSCLLVTTLQPVIISSLNISGYSIAGVNILSSMGIVFSLEAGFQVGYLIYQKFASNEGVGAEKFSAKNPLSFLTQGSNLASSFVDSAVHYATGGPIKNAVKEVNSYRDYWTSHKATKQKLAMEGGLKNLMRKNVADVKAGVEPYGYDFNDRMGGTGFDKNSFPMPQPTGRIYGAPEKPEVAPAGGGGGAAAGGGGGAAVPVPVPVAPPRLGPPRAEFAGKVRVRDGVVPSDWKTNVTPGKRILGGLIPVNRGFQRIGNLAGGTAVNVAHKLLETGHNAAAYVLRKTGIAGLVCGAAGIIGGERGTTAVKWALGSSKKRMTHAEKEWAIANNKIVKKDAKTGDLHVYEPGIVPELGDNQSNRMADTARGDNTGSQWYIPKQNPQPDAVPDGEDGEAPPVEPAPIPAAPDGEGGEAPPVEPAPAPAPPVGVPLPPAAPAPVPPDVVPPPPPAPVAAPVRHHPVGPPPAPAAPGRPMARVLSPVNPTYEHEDNLGVLSGRISVANVDQPLYTQAPGGVRVANHVGHFDDRGRPLLPTDPQLAGQIIVTRANTVVGYFDENGIPKYSPSISDERNRELMEVRVAAQARNRGSS